MSTEITLNQLYFGDLEAYDEARLHREFFASSFVQPGSMSTDQLTNDNKFIIVGRKGAGKTAVQMHFSNTVLSPKGYLTQFFRFFDDMKPSDYTEITRTQSHISFVEAIDEKKIFLNYDYRPAWERIFLNKLAVMLISEGFESPFTKFCAPEGNSLRSIFQGISRALKINMSAELFGISAGIGLDLSQLAEGEKVSLQDHNLVARRLLVEHCYAIRSYFFVDELVFSKLDATEDEIRVRAAMVRDIIRTARELNTDLAINGIDMHFVCSLRPEVRNLINDLDSEIGKVIDGRDVSLIWISQEDGEAPLDEVLKKKVECSYYKHLNLRTFMCEEISFGNHTMTISEFLKTNTWGRPRDVVRLLQAIQKASPHATYIGEDEIKAGLDEYSRASLKELFDELGVIYGQQMVMAVKKGITKRTYESQDKFWKSIGPHLTGFSKEDVIDELFELGVIQGFLDNPPRYFAAHRGETYLKSQHKIRIHPALWNELGIRSL